MVAAIEHSTNQGSQMNSDSKEERSSHKTSSKSPNKELLAGSSRREADREGWASDRERLGKWTPSSVEVGNYNLELLERALTLYHTLDCNFYKDLAKLF